MDSRLSDMAAVTSSSTLAPLKNLGDLSVIMTKLLAWPTKKEYDEPLKISNSHFFEFFDEKIWIQTGISTRQP